jgi:hypothetical protein
MCRRKKKVQETKKENKERKAKVRCLETEMENVQKAMCWKERWSDG